MPCRSNAAARSAEELPRQPGRYRADRPPRIGQQWAEHRRQRGPSATNTRRWPSGAASTSASASAACAAASSRLAACASDASTCNGDDVRGAALSDGQCPPSAQHRHGRLRVTFGDQQPGEQPVLGVLRVDRLVVDGQTAAPDPVLPPPPDRPWRAPARPAAPPAGRAGRALLAAPSRPPRLRPAPRPGGRATRPGRDRGTASFVASSRSRGVPTASASPMSSPPGGSPSNAFPPPITPMRDGRTLAHAYRPHASAREGTTGGTDRVRHPSARGH